MADVRQLSVEDAADAARVHRSSFDERLPWLAGLHKPTEDVDFYRTVVFIECSVWGAFENNQLVGVIALREGWIDQLYVVPEAQSQGIGSDLVAIAKSSQSSLSLWTFRDRRVPPRSRTVLHVSTARHASPVRPLFHSFWSNTIGDLPRR